MPKRLAIVARQSAILEPRNSRMAIESRIPTQFPHGRDQGRVAVPLAIDERSIAVEDDESDPCRL